MTGEPEYHEVDYIGAKEQSAYMNHGGAQAEAMQVTPFGGIASVPMRVLAQVQANEAARKYGHNQAEQLSQNHRLWDKPEALGATHYLSYDHKELKRFVTEKFDPSSVHEAGRYYNKVGNDLIDFSGRIRQAAMKTEQSWQGQAGDAMRAKMTSLSDHMGHSGQAAQLTGNQLGMQAEAGERARNSMPEPVEVDVRSELKRINGIEDPAEQTAEANKLQKKIEDSQAAHQEAARVVGTMEGDFGSAAALTPKFAPPPPPPSEDGGGAPGMPSGGGVGGFVSPGGGSGGGPAGNSSQSTGPTLGPATYSNVDTGSSRSGPMLQGSNTWSSWASTDSGGSQGGQRGQDGTQWRRGPNGEWQRQNPYNGRWAPAPYGPNGPGTGRGGTAGGRAGGAGGRAGGAGSGTGGGRTGGSVGGGRAGGGVAGRGSVPGNPLASGGQSGGRVAGTPGSATSSASASSTSSARGGRMPMGAMGGRGQDGDDGDEHERKYVMETDEAWDDLGIQRVAPPVLGALPDEEGGGR